MKKSNNWISVNPHTEHIHMCECRRLCVILSMLFGRLFTRVRCLWLPTKDFVTIIQENEDKKSTENVFDHLKGKLVSEKEEEGRLGAASDIENTGALFLF